MSHLNDTAQAIWLIWEALHDSRPNFDNDRWETICESMATIQEDSGVENPSLYWFEDFKSEGTGGGCMALVRYLSEGYYMMATTEDGASMPECGDNVLLGLYRAGPDADMGTCITWSYEYDNREQIERDVNHTVREVVGFLIENSGQAIGNNPAAGSSWKSRRSSS